MKKTYNVKLNKFFDKNMGCTVMEVIVTKDLTDLLKPFTIMEETRITDWTKTSLHERSTEFVYYERYLIKSILKNSVRWIPLLDLLFTKELLESQKIMVPLNNLRAFTSVTESTESIKQLIKVAEEISHDREISITLNVSED